MNTKQEIRLQVKLAKKQLSTAEKLAEETATFAKVEAQPLFQQAKHILLYYSMPDELPTHATIKRWTEELGKQVYLPRVNGDNLEILAYDGHLCNDNSFQIGEPTGNQLINPALIDLVIVPAMALDAHCQRCGRGKGFYDRLLPQCVNAAIWGVALRCQLVPSVPVDSHDVPLDAVFTSSEKYFSR